MGKFCGGGSLANLVNCPKFAHPKLSKVVVEINNLLFDLLSHQTLLNQALTGLWLACTWFLKIDPVQIVGMHVCTSALEAINN